jgi:hypothetical protein
MAFAQQHIELGQVNWMRNLDQAIAKSKSEQKPIFILFQEVPGCATCRNYGHQVLSHPLVVEAIETLFIPVAIFNNKKGKDAETLTFFHEPAWNNPVVRIVDQNKIDLTPRVSGNYQIDGVVLAMLAALESERIEVPEYLRFLQKEFSSQAQQQEVYFSMYCFWTGEKTFGAIEGVTETEAGYMDGKEVVRVRYDATQIALSQLVNQGESAACADFVYLNDQKSELDVKGVKQSKLRKASNFRIDKETKYYLRHSIYRFVPMTSLQACRINSLIGQNKSADQVLSDRQLQVLNYIKAHPNAFFKNAIGIPIEIAWKEIVDYLSADSIFKESK